MKGSTDGCSPRSGSHSDLFGLGNLRVQKPEKKMSASVLSLAMMAAATLIPSDLHKDVQRGPVAEYDPYEIVAEEDDDDEDDDFGSSDDEDEDYEDENDDGSWTSTDDDDEEEDDDLDF